jgi:hypothetical protein
MPTYTCVDMSPVLCLLVVFCFVYPKNYREPPFCTAQEKNFKAPSLPPPPSRKCDEVTKLLLAKQEKLITDTIQSLDI